MEYNIKENVALTSGEELEIQDKVIEKRGHVIEFTMSNVDANIKHNKKTRVELEAKLKVDNAKQENILYFHEFLKDMSEEDLFTAWLYKDTQNTIDLVQSKLDEVVAQIESDEAEVEVIKSQIPELNTIKTPYDDKEDNDNQ